MLTRIVLALSALAMLACMLGCHAGGNGYPSG